MLLITQERSSVASIAEVVAKVALHMYGFAAQESFVYKPAHREHLQRELKIMTCCNPDILTISKLN